MIFAPIPSLLGFLILFVLPLAGVVSTILLVGGALARWVGRRRKHPLSRKARTWLWALAGLTLVLDMWSSFLAYEFVGISRAVDQAAANRAARQDFLLPRNFQYGELLIPAGSQINRFDPFDNGEQDLPLALRGLRAVRFSQPVQIAGATAIAMEVYPPRLQLVEDQTVGPMFAYNKRGELVRDGQPASVACRKGQIASFNAPLIAYDVVAEFAKPEPDGPAARFKPSQWQFLGCTDDGAISLPPVAHL